MKRRFEVRLPLRPRPPQTIYVEISTQIPPTIETISEQILLQGLLEYVSINEVMWNQLTFKEEK